jgi:phosphoribosylanthranilate isomerase
MSLKTKVKAGNITNLSDARYCAGMGVDWLGFPIDSIDAKTFGEITGWVTGPQFILELSTGAIPESLGEYPVEFLQVDFKQLKEIPSSSNVRFIVKLSISDWVNVKAELSKNIDRISFLLLTDLNKSDSSYRDTLEEIQSYVNIFIELESSNYTLEEVLNLTVSGISISGKNELKPGLKDYTELAEVLEKLEVD